MTDNQNSAPDGRFVEAIDAEIVRREHKRSFKRAIFDTLRVLIVIAAIAALLSTLWIPVFQIYGNSMEPTLVDGELIVTVKSGRFSRGELVAFYFNNKILIKRVIALGGDEVNIDQDGNVYINGIALDEPYLTSKNIGECDIEFPYVVPDGRLFVLGDSRQTSVDSRSTMIGPVSEEQIVGKVFFRVWPFARFGFI